MILDSDQDIIKRINNSLFTPEPPDISAYKDTMKVNTMDWDRWVSEVPYEVFRDVFERQIEIQQEYEGRTGEYIYGIKFKDGKILNFIFKGIYNYHSDRNLLCNNRVLFNIILSSAYLRDEEPARKELNARQTEMFKNDGLTTMISCSLKMDKEDILKKIYDFMISHSKSIIFQSFADYLIERTRQKLRTYKLYGVPH